MFTWNQVLAITGERRELLGSLYSERMAYYAIECAKGVANLNKRLDQVNELCKRMADNPDCLQLTQSQLNCLLLWGGSVEIEQAQLPALRKLVGQVKITEKYAVGADTIQVNLVAKAFEGLTFAYSKKYRGDKKCKIVTQASSYVNYSLVCENGNG